MQINNQHLLFSYQNFITRLDEVREYVNYVLLIANMSSPALSDINSSSLHQSTISRDLQKTLRASTYLLLYNLMESTMSEAINAIHKTIKDEQRDILDLSEKLHRVILTSFQRGLTESKIGEYAKTNQDIRNNLLDLGYDKQRLFSGNIDCVIIDDYCKRYGFQAYVYREDGTTPLQWDPEIIKNIKKKRNDLAHGSVSFAECGQNIVIDTIHNNLENVYAVLMAVFNGLNYFLETKRYLRTPPQQT